MRSCCSSASSHPSRPPPRPRAGEGPRRSVVATFDGCADAQGVPQTPLRRQSSHRRAQVFGRAHPRSPVAGLRAHPAFEEVPAARDRAAAVFRRVSTPAQACMNLGHSITDASLLA